MKMSRTQTACLCLIASAFVLGGLVFAQLSDRQSQAHAEMVVSKGNVLQLTTQFQADTELLYMIDERRDLLLAYSVDVNRGNVELLGRLNLARVFNRQAREENEEPERRRAR
ncbi:MAG: hypothetical protein WD294_00080 [Phycisphaeraceae bacterium]